MTEGTFLNLTTTTPTSFAKNFQQRYLPWFLKRELGWILVKQAIFQKQPGRIIPSLRGLWSGYWAGLRNRKIPDPQ